MNTKALTSLEISEKGAKVYLAGLSLGATTVQELAKKTGLKRPTVYLHMDDLQKKGLFETIQINKKNYYRATNPEALSEKLKKSVSDLESLLPELIGMHTNTLGKPQIRVLDSKEGIAQVYGEMKKANSLRVWSDLGKIFPLFQEEYLLLGEAVKDNGIGIREILTDTKESRRYFRLLSKVAGPTYSARTATAEGLANDTVIYGNVVAIFRLHEFNMFVVRIEDKTIADSMRALFEMAWKSAKAFR